MKPKIAVIGAGIIGLATAYRFIEKGYDVAIFARDVTSNNITSRNAPALWVAYKAAPEKLIMQWARPSLEMYQTLNHTAGVEILEFVEYAKEQGVPQWARILGQHIDIPPAELPAGYTFGYAGKIHRIDPSIFLDYLIAQIKENGGVIIQKDLKNLLEIPAAFKIMINCTGVWASQLVTDDETYPIRGQYVLTEKPPGLNRITLTHLDENSYALIVPRVNDCWLGGSAVMGDWNTADDPVISERILQRAQNLEPLLKNVKVLATGAGLRPGRTEVRLMPEQLSDNRTVIHNYGHGGAGFVTAWGCADEVVQLVQGL